MVTGELFLAAPAADLDRLARLEDAGPAALVEYAGANLPNFDAVAPPAVRPGARPGRAVIRRARRSAPTPTCCAPTCRRSAR
ncbi:hypothetical protein [Micromonospora sicca]|uniref:hypothetical protein n=1 Tax=Micromonospora sicca TaxID=2202420 RepID=UPI001F162B21|nr:hypothetical protein [Micromonospora sp. 4G51]